MEEKTKIRKIKSIMQFIYFAGFFCLLISALCFSFGAFILGGVFIGFMLMTFISKLALEVKVQEYMTLKQTIHFKGQFPLLENYGFVLKGTVYTRITPRGNNTYTVYINFDKQIYCEKNGKEVPVFNFVISDLIRDGLVTIEREVI